jgi:hypothetical protein
MRSKERSKEREREAGARKGLVEPMDISQVLTFLSY